MIRPENRGPADGGSTPSRNVFGNEGSALVEFAVALPLLMVLVVGVFDFGGAFNAKQELNNAVREGARLGSTLPTNDLSNATPPTVDAIRFLVDSYLQASRIPDCGLGLTSLSPSPPPPTLTWVYTAQGSPCTSSNSLVLTIVRGSPSCNVVTSANVNIPCTHVTINYPYQWHFNSVIQLIVPGSSYGPYITIQTDATATNMD